MTETRCAMHMMLDAEPRRQLNDLADKERLTISAIVQIMIEDIDQIMTKDRLTRASDLMIARIRRPRTQR